MTRRYHTERELLCVTANQVLDFRSGSFAPILACPVMSGQGVISEMLVDKLAANYLAFVKLASIRIWLRANESMN
jgi:hypothetical protein